MERISGFGWMVALSVAAVLLGAGLCFPLFSYLPFYWSVGLAGVFVLSFLGCLIAGRPAGPAVYGGAGLIYSLLFLAVLFTFAGVERVEVYDCSWKLDGERVKINLDPAGNFNWTSVSSDALVEQLEREHPATVKVEVPITRDFGQMRARGRIKQVNGIPVKEHQ